MAIDPATLKLAVKAAVSVITDESKRRKFLNLLPVVGIFFKQDVILVGFVAVVIAVYRR